MTDPMTLAQYARRVGVNYHTLYARVDRRINRGETNGLLLRVDGRLLPMPAAIWRTMTKPLPLGRPRRTA
jgi:hypothetical protein